jgi:hypothetical protein
MAEEEKKKPEWPVTRSFLLLSFATVLVASTNGYLAAVAASNPIFKLVGAVGGWGALGGFFFSALIVFLLPPLVGWKKSKAGRPLVWCLAWNVGLLCITLSFGPVGSWMKSQGATPVALVLGEDSWLVTTALGEQLGWGVAKGLPVINIADGSEPYVKRWGEIVEGLKTAESIADLEPIVCKANLETVGAWPKRRQLLGLKYVRDQIELLEFDAKKEKRKWQLYDFENGETAVSLEWRAYKKKGSRDDYLSQNVKLVNEEGQWKADFSEDLKTFREIIQKRESSSDR